MENKKVVVITGPTAVGKSDIAVLVAKKIDAEIISADSTQIYKNFNIGSGKITPKEMSGVAHHMLDILNFDEEFSVALYKQLAEQKIAEIFAKGKNVVICGGTGLYIKSLTQGFKFYNVERNNDLRLKLEKRAIMEGLEALFEILKDLDPDTAQKIDRNNKVRLIRAIEIAKSENKKQAYEKPKFLYEVFVLNSERQVLYNRINKRVEGMFEQGLVEEVEDLVKQGANLSHSSFKSIGYKELYNFVANKQGTLDEVKEDIKQASRKYAKRQLTWFRSVENANWINVENIEDSAKEILHHLKDFS